MKLKDFNDWTTLLSNLGVILGIIFLATELQQTNELMESERRYNRLQLVLEGNRDYIENPELVDAALKALSGEELSEREDYITRRYMNNLLNAWQWTWLEIGDTDEFPIEQYRENFNSNQYVQAYWEERKSRLLPEFVDFWERNIVQR